MPIAVNTVMARAMSRRFDEALEVVHNEFHGLDTHHQYRNAFARLLKADPLGRVLMMGTDQRDLFVPVLRDLIGTTVPQHGHIFDLGAGDGQTFALVADRVAQGTTVSIEEPNAGYVADYVAYLATQPHLKQGAALACGFDEIESRSQPCPYEESVDLIMALHMIYFLADLQGSLCRMVRFLKPGGALFLVVADETNGYTGLSLRAFIEAGGNTGANEQHMDAIALRHRLLADPADGGGGILEVLKTAVPERAFTLETCRQPSRLYGHSLCDLIALCNIAVLAEPDDLRKYDAACALIRGRPDLVDLRIEDDGPRKGMWSIAQHQHLAILRRVN